MRGCGHSTTAAVNNTSGGGGGGTGSSYLGVEVPGATPPSAITTATSQSPSVTISWSLVSLVFSGRYSTDINGKESGLTPWGETYSLSFTL